MADEILAEPIAEPIDEVLQQTAEQTLKLAHIDEGLRELRGAVGDVAETLEAGFIELRTVSARKTVEKGSASSGMDASTLHLLGDRLDELERDTRRVHTLQRLVLVLALIQVLGIAALVAIGLGYLSPPHVPVAPEPVPPAVVAPVQTAPKEAPAPVPEPPPAPKGKKKKR